MKIKDFNYSRFTEWKQDTKNYSDITTERQYVARIGQDLIDYCINEIGTCNHDAYLISDHFFLIECERLNIEITLK